MKPGNVSGSEGSGNATTRHGESVWINSNGVLPPVDCPLLIELSNVLVPATRTGFIAKKTDAMEYRLPNGALIHGRYRWTYP
jgi:hypothetical protein